jgi:predicted transcriptional regulator
MSRGMPTVRNFHLPLPDPLYRRLRDAAERAHQPATTIARYAIDHWLRQQQKSMVSEAIAAYAADVAGTRDDLDEHLEAASLDLWRDEPRIKKRRKRKR